MVSSLCLQECIYILAALVVMSGRYLLSIGDDGVTSQPQPPPKPSCGVLLPLVRQAKAGSRRLFCLGIGRSLKQCLRCCVWVSVWAPAGRGASAAGCGSCLPSPERGGLQSRPGVGWWVLVVSLHVRHLSGELLEGQTSPC